MASRTEIHFGVSTFGSSTSRLRAQSMAEPASLSDQLRSALGAAPSASDEQMASLAESLKTTLEAVAAGSAGSAEAAAALAALSKG